jgi:peroxiredoxin
VLERNGVKLLCVSIGTPERAKDFVKETGFPGELLYGAAASLHRAQKSSGEVSKSALLLANIASFWVMSELRQPESSRTFTPEPRTRLIGIPAS